MKDILQGIELFNNCDFFEAHDFFEDLWIDCKSNNKKFYQSLVHISVGSFHLISGNYNGCISQFEKFIMKIQTYLPEFNDINTEKLKCDIVLLLDILKKQRETFKPINFWELIPKIETTNKNSQN